MGLIRVFGSVDTSSSIAAAPRHKCSDCRDVSPAQPDIFALGVVRLISFRSCCCDNTLRIVVEDTIKQYAPGPPFTPFAVFVAPRFCCLAADGAPQPCLKNSTCLTQSCWEHAHNLVCHLFKIRLNTAVSVTDS